ncbi:hypothetical protein LAZ67_1007094 [Cordylochernes scorpioides]|uniref:Peptidase A2 domain-containing protein n=1 Tax=Cordylochernes scorpioides TaxID=51811 RepID=A0ABY6K080_9ARAC|nr:hypothetical protein LAZ67_1007094 [Cordylochernes scorpioides]
MEEPDKNQAESSVKVNNDALGVTSIHNTTCLISNQEDSFVLLSTATIMVMNHQGKYQPCRALIDTASQATLITRDCLKKLNLKPSRTRVELAGIGGQILDRPDVVININFTSHFNLSKVFKTNAFVVNKILYFLYSREPSNMEMKVNQRQSKHYWDGCFLEKLKYFKRNPETIKHCTHSIVRLINGNQHFPYGKKNSTPNLCDPFEDEIHEIHEKEISGRYIVRLPFKYSSLLGESKPQSINCFLRME